jgi:hypothetical protein
MRCGSQCLSSPAALLSASSLYPSLFLRSVGLDRASLPCPGAAGGAIALPLFRGPASRSLPLPEVPDAAEDEYVDSDEELERQQKEEEEVRGDKGLRG